MSFANELADEAGRRLLHWFGKTTASTKPDGSFLTEADLDVDRYLTEAIQARFPQHGILSEENDHTFAGREYTWILDPLDGTNSFANGLLIWGTSIALLRDGKPLLGLLDCPRIGQRFQAGRGRGAWLNGKKLQISPTGALHENQFITMGARVFQHLELQLPLKPRVFGAGAYELVMVASGSAVASLQFRLKIWDVAAAWPIVQEAGGTVGALFDGPAIFPLTPGKDYVSFDLPVIFATDPDLWQQVRAAMRSGPGAQGLKQRLAEYGWAVDLA